MEVIPAIDLLGGRCVRLFQGDFARVSHYDEDPVAIATRYRAAGLTRLHVVDLDGARTGDPANLGVIAAMAAGCGVAVQAGGGIRDLQRARTLLAAGASRVVVGSVAVQDPPAVLGWLQDLGADKLVLALDVRLDPRLNGGEPSVVTHGWQQDSGLGLWSIMEWYLAGGALHFLCTDVSKDGTLTGPNLRLYEECMRRFPAIQMIASGGVSGRADLLDLERTGVPAVVTGKALLDGRLTLEEIATFSPGA